MIYRIVKKGLAALFFLLSLHLDAQTQFAAGSFKLNVDKKGFVTKLGNKETGKNYLYADTVTPLMTVVSDKMRLLPSSMVYNQARKKLSLLFAPSTI